MKGTLALDGGQMGHGAQVHDLLRRCPRHSMAKPVWRQAMTSEWSPKMFSAWVATVRADTWNTAGQQLAGDLVHVGDHQQQALGGGVGGGQGTGGQRAVDGAGGAGLGLHLHHLDLWCRRCSSGRLALHWSTIVGHGAGRRDGVDSGNLGKRIVKHAPRRCCHPWISFFLQP